MNTTNPATAKALNREELHQILATEPHNHCMAMLENKAIDISASFVSDTQTKPEIKM